MRIEKATRFLIGAAALSTLLSVVGCSSNGGGGTASPANSNVYLTGDSLWTRKHVSQAQPAPAPQKAPEKPAAKPVATTGQCAPVVGPDQTVSSQAFPTGEIGSSAIVVYTVMPKEVRVNQPYEYELQVCNLTNTTLDNVVVIHENDSNLEIVSSNPSSSQGPDGSRQWVLGSLAPRDSETIVVTGRAGSTGISSNCVSVVYNNFLCAETVVVEPALALRKTATSEAMLCDPITLTYVVTNSGTGACDSVVVTDSLPAGLTTADGRNAVRFDAGTLAPGQSREFSVEARASRTGTFSSPASAASGCGADATADPTTTVVRQPKLAMTSDCVDRVYLGRNITFTFNLTNSGDGACQETVISAPLPSGTEFVSASNGGRLEGNRIVWNAGTVTANGGTRTVSMTVNPLGIGAVTARATAECVCADPASADCTTDVQGIPAILLEVVDEPDPIRVGDSVTYIITVTNQGSATDRNIRIVCEIPGEQTFVSAGGATNGSASGQTVTFAPLPSLAAKATATFRVVVRANAAGNIRFKTTMTSDQFTRPIEETEATYLYE